MNQNHFFHFLVIAILSSILVGCISFGMTEKKCQELNAYNYGHLTALHKLHSNFFNKHKETCAQKYQITLNQAEYDKGYKQGIKELCTRQGGYDLGLHGTAYRKICSKKSEPEFLTGYKEGRIKYLEAEVARLSTQVILQSTQISSQADEIQRVQSQVNDIQHQQLDIQHQQPQLKTLK